MVAETLHRLLRALGCRVFSFISGQASLQWVSELGSGEAPDLVLIDLDLPDMTGEVLAALLRQEDSLREARLVLHTGRSRSELTDSCLACFDEVLLKPASYEELRRLLSALAHRSLQTELD